MYSAELWEIIFFKSSTFEFRGIFTVITFSLPASLTKTVKIFLSFLGASAESTLSLKRVPSIAASCFPAALDNGPCFAAVSEEFGCWTFLDTLSGFPRAAGLVSSGDLFGWPCLDCLQGSESKLAPLCCLELALRLFDFKDSDVRASSHSVRPSRKDEDEAALISFVWSQAASRFSFAGPQHGGANQPVRSSGDYKTARKAESSLRSSW